MLRKGSIIDGIIIGHQEDDASQPVRLKSYEEKLTELQPKENGIYSTKSGLI